jgi:hypothetical protein
MNKKIQKAILFLGIIFSFFLKAGLAFALEVKYPTIGGFSLNSTSSFPEYVKYFFNIGMASAGIIALMAVVFGAAYYLVSFGRGKFTDEGKEWIKAGLLGLFITLAAYLIMYTINPNLTILNLNSLSRLNFGISGFNGGGGATPRVANFQEIPIGTLTENLLTRTMACYGFDVQGDPIDGDKIMTDANCKDNAGCQGIEECDLTVHKCYTPLPTYLNHDRADCLSELTEGAQRKGQQIAALTSEITKLMNKCSCSDFGNCTPTCGANGCALKSNGLPTGTGGQCKGNNGDSSQCGGTCVGAACKPPDSMGDCCPGGIKDLIEHGNISAGSIGEVCDTFNDSFAGLDEFRCPNPIKDDHASCSDIETFVEEAYTVNGATYNLIDQKDWQKLNLLQQLTYFQSKIAEIKKSIQDDIDVLDQARTALGKCYWAVPYLDLANTYQSNENLPKQQVIVLTQKIFTDPQTMAPVNPVKYCTGFNYGNSSCSQQCTNSCPDTSDQALQCFKACSNIKCAENDENSIDCSDEHTTCVNKCYNSRPCTQLACKKDSDCSTGQKCDTGTGTCVSDNNCSQDSDCANGGTCDTAIGKCFVPFGDCITSCQSKTTCPDLCDKKYLACSDQNRACHELCQDNSRCILSNSQSCLLDSQGFENCATRTVKPSNQGNIVEDQGNIKYCVNNAYLCKNGSDQFAGYSDCVDSLAVASSPACNYFDRSASYLNEHPECQKCLDPYNLPDLTSSCFIPTYPTASCQETCPETAKCPQASDCPSCPCDKIDQSIDFSVPSLNSNTTTELGAGSSNSSIGEYFDLTTPVSATQIVGPQCNNYSYNDDPLTYYCEINVLQDLTSEPSNPPKAPLGSSYTCPKDKEIPVGQAVDDAENWAKKTIRDADTISQDIQKLYTDMQQMGNAQDNPVTKDYCRCGAKLNNGTPTGKPLCTTDCGYTKTLVDVPIMGNIPVTIWVEVTDPGTGQTTMQQQTQFQWGVVGNTQQWNCSCAVTKCQGSPCEQAVDYLSSVWNDYRQLDLDSIDFYTTNIEGPRSDIFKELAYSRKMTNSCGSTSSSYVASVKLLNCTRVMDEIISPIDTSTVQEGMQTITGYCYGQNLGNVLNTSLTDNWFCCQNQNQ